MQKCFNKVFFKTVYPAQCRCKFSCDTVLNRATIQFSATSKLFQYVLEVYEQKRCDCQILVDAIRKHYEEGLHTGAIKIRDVFKHESVVGKLAASNGWTWKTVYVQVEKSQTTSVQFGAMYENNAILVSISGFSIDSKTSEALALLESILSNLQIEPCDSWIMDSPD